VKREDIKVELDDSVLTIRAKRASEHVGNAESRILRSERNTGVYHRKISLPPLDKDAKVTAELDLGVLAIRVPCSSKSLRKQVQVTSRL
jgi:HSP20 family protein